ncbi:MAG: hypothetical protein E7334_09330, partial [Clostridiales bacterium]|nr:hypothetical protein [Clostridiales bacterium]
GANPLSPKSMEIVEATPSRLIYEVGLKDDIDPLTIADNAALAGSDGKYVFYTNDWQPLTNDELNGKGYSYLTNRNATSFFEPSEENEAYYYSVDTPVFLDQDGNHYTGDSAPDKDSEVYRRYIRYTKKGNSVSAAYVFEAIPDEVLESAANFTKLSDGTWIVNKGTPYRYSTDAALTNPYEKEENITGTLDIALQKFHHAQSVGKITDHYHLDTWLGNNGKLVIDPYEGIKITKKIDKTITDLTTVYKFNVTTNDNFTGDYTLVIENKDGSRENASTISFTNGTAQVRLKEGQSAYILSNGTMAGKTFTVSEVDGAGYSIKSVKVNGVVSGTVAEIKVSADTITPVEFENTKTKLGSAVISKTVSGELPTGATSDFSFSLKITGEDITRGAEYQAVKHDGTSITLTVGANGAVSPSFTLKHGETLTINGLPVGSVVEATENDYSSKDIVTMVKVGEGAAVVSLSAGTTVAEENTPAIAFTNVYPKSATVENVALLEVKKRIDLKAATDFEGTFNFKLQRYNGSEFVDVEGKTASITVTKSDSSVINNAVKIDISDLRFENSGTYAFRVVEVVPNTPAEYIVYDSTPSYFYIDVAADPNNIAALKITAVRPGSGSEVTGTESPWTVTANFDNRYITTGEAQLTLNIDKTVTSASGVELSPAGYKFALYEANETFVVAENSEPIKTAESGAGGYTGIVLDYTAVGTYYYVLEETNTNVAGITYATNKYYIKVVVGSEGGSYTLSAEVYTDQAMTNKIYPASAPSGQVLKASGYRSAVVPAPTVEPTPTPTIEPTASPAAEPTAAPTAEPAAAQTAAPTATPAEVPTPAPVIEPAGTPAQEPAATPTAAPTLAPTDEPTPAPTGEPAKAPSDENAADDPNGQANGGNTGLVFLGLKNASPLVPARLGVRNNSGLLSSILFSLNLGDGDGANSVGEGTPAPTATPTPAPTVISTAAPTALPSPTPVTIKSIILQNEGQQNSTPSNIVALTIDGLSFENVYTPGKATFTLTGTKTLTGREHKDGDSFSFRLLKEDGSEIETAAVYNSNTQNYTFSFDTLTFTKVGKHVYTVKEVIPDGAVNNKLDGIVYDASEYTVEFNVTHDATNHQLVVGAPVITKNNASADSLSFVNRYEAEPAEVEISGTKEFTGSVSLAKDMFSFVLKDDSGTDIETVKNGVPTVKEFTFSKLTFDKAGTYNYTVSEVVPGQNPPNGITYDTKEYNVTVNVTDNGSGKLSASVVYTVGGIANGTIAFTNTYSAAPTRTSLSGNKTVTGGNIANETFTFELYKATYKPEDHFYVAPGTTAAATATNDQSGSFEFPDTLSALNFYTTGSYRFVIKEQQGSDPQVSYDKTVYKIELVVTDNGQGVLEIPENLVTVYRVSEDGKEEKVGLSDINFSNRIAPVPISITLGGQKKYNIALPTQDAEKFSFSLYEAMPDGEGKILSIGDPIFEVKHDNDGKYEFKDEENAQVKYLTYTHSGTWYYIIRENIPDNTQNADGSSIEYSDEEYVVKVTTELKQGAEANGRDKLDHSIELFDKNGNKLDTATASALDFTNRYVPKAKEFTIEGNKKLVNASGGEMSLDGRQFSFAAYETNSAYEIPADAQPAATAKNDANGMFTMNISIDREGDHYFAVKELDTSYSDISKDATIYHVKVNAKIENGELVIGEPEIKLGNDQTQITFTNRYNFVEPSPVLAVIDVKKEMVNAAMYGADLSGFKFVLTDANGRILQTAFSDRNGFARFNVEMFEYSEVGSTYIYRVYEEAGGIDNMVYSNRVYTVSVTVGYDHSTDSLYTTMKKDSVPMHKNEALVFTNIYQPSVPAIPNDHDRPHLPKTGDAGILPWIMVIFAGLVGIYTTLFMMFLKPKRRYRK